MPSDKQISRCLIGAMIAPLITVSAGESWLWLLAVTGICGVAALCGRPLGKWGSILQWAAAVVALAILLPQAQQCWPTDPHPAVPLVLLTLAAWSAVKGFHSVARVGCVLFWFIIIMYSAVMLAMIPEVKVQYMKPTWGMGSWTTVLLLLLPAAPLIGRTSNKAWIAGIIASVAAFITTAVLSGPVSNKGQNAFYEAVRCVKMRLEPVLGAGATVGWFLLLTVLLSVSGECAARLHDKIRTIAILVSGTIGAVTLLCGLHIPSWIGVIFIAISWVLMPLLIQSLECRKKMKKSEKTP